MKILLTGIETNNKGAELMLYAILQEIERKFPNAVVYIPPTRVKQGLGYVNTTLDFRYTTNPVISKIITKLRVRKIFKIMNIPLWFLFNLDIVKDADWYFDGSGFAYGDQWNLTDENIRELEYKLTILKNRGCRIIILPQALGPAIRPTTKRVLSVLSQKSSVLMPREQVSYQYVMESGVVDMNKVRVFSDFTSLVKGVFPSRYQSLKNGVCIIPNMKMISQGKISYENYLDLLVAIIKEAHKSGHPVYLLNHEGRNDEILSYKCQESVGGNIEVVTGLNALEVKGLIETAYITITSRFHGLASSLNSCVPGLATSWSHKYEELFRDYGITNSVLPLDNKKKAAEMVRFLLEPENNAAVRQHLCQQVVNVKKLTNDMWNLIWSISQ